MEFIANWVAFHFFYFWRDLFIKYVFNKAKFEEGSSLQRTLSTVFGSALSSLSVVVFLWLTYLLLSGERLMSSFIFIMLIKTAFLVGYTEAYIRSKEFRNYLDTTSNSKQKVIRFFVFILIVSLFELFRYLGAKLSKDLEINYLWNLGPFLIWIIHGFLRRKVIARIHFGKEGTNPEPWTKQQIAIALLGFILVSAAIILLILKREVHW